MASTAVRKHRAPLSAASSLTRDGRLSVVPGRRIRENGAAFSDPSRAATGRDAWMRRCRRGSTARRSGGAEAHARTARCTSGETIEIRH